MMLCIAVPLLGIGFMNNQTLPCTDIVLFLESTAVPYNDQRIDVVRPQSKGEYVIYTALKSTGGKQLLQLNLPAVIEEHFGTDTKFIRQRAVESHLQILRILLRV